MISDYINQDFGKYWPCFKKVAFALYDQETVYLFNHPDYAQETAPVVIPRQSEEFNGADTLILFANYPTAIVNLANHQSREDIYAILVHELFHGFQYLQTEQRFPSEVLGMTYPISKENIELRNRERNYLYRAIFTKDKHGKTELIRKFIQLRERRKRLLGDFFTYELAVETTEGPAWYIELLAFADISGVDKEDLLKEYLNPLLDAQEANLHMRRSCYHSGLAICLLLEEFYDHWQENFFTSEQMLYEYLTEIFMVNEDSLANEKIVISTETENIVAQIAAMKAKHFRQFASQKGIHIFIEGDITIIAFDPMNVVSNRNKMLHKNFLTIQINQHEFFISQPVIVYYRKKFNQVNQLHLILTEKPQIKDDSIHIQGIGNIKGDLIKQNGDYYIRCK